MTELEIRLERFKRKKEDKLIKSLNIENTLLYHIEQIVEMAENSELTDSFFAAAEINIDFIVKKMRLTVNQAVLFSIFIEKSYENRIYVEDIANMTRCRMVKMITMLNDFDELEKRQLVRCNRSDDTTSYRVPKEVVAAVKQSIVYKPKSICKLNTSQFFEHLDRLFKEKDEGETSYQRLEEEIQTLIQENASLHFSRQIESYKKKLGDGNNLMLLLFFCHKFVNLDDDSISIYEWRKLFDNNWTYRSMKMGLQRGVNDLITNEYLECTNDNGFEDKENMKLTDSAKEKLFPNWISVYSIR